MAVSLTKVWALEEEVNSIKTTCNDLKEERTNLLIKNEEMQARIDGAKHITSQKEMSPQVKGEIFNVKQGQSQNNRRFDSLEQEKKLMNLLISGLPPRLQSPEYQL